MEILRREMRKREERDEVMKAFRERDDEMKQ